MYLSTRDENLGVKFSYRNFPNYFSCCLIEPKQGKSCTTLVTSYFAITPVSIEIQFKPIRTESVHQQTIILAKTLVKTWNFFVRAINSGISVHI